jgi:hypothetical protein
MFMGIGENDGFRGEHAVPDAPQAQGWIANRGRITSRLTNAALIVLKMPPAAGKMPENPA